MGRDVTNAQAVLTHGPNAFLPRHALPLFTSLLNVVCAYDPVGYGIPYNHLLFSDYREQLVEQAVQILIVTLEHDGGVPHRPATPSSIEEQEVLASAPPKRKKCVNMWLTLFQYICVSVCSPQAPKTCL